MAIKKTSDCQTDEIERKKRVVRERRERNERKKKMKTKKDIFIVTFFSGVWAISVISGLFLPFGLYRLHHMWTNDFISFAEYWRGLVCHSRNVEGSIRMCLSLMCRVGVYFQSFFNVR